MPEGVGLACAGAAAWMTCGSRAGLRRARRLLAGGGTAERPGSRPWDRVRGWTRRLSARWPLWAPVAVGALIALLSASVLPLPAGIAGVPLLRRVRMAQAERRARDERDAAVIALCATLAGEVRAGRQPGEALLRAARESAGLGQAQAAVLAAARFGGDVPSALLQAARRPGVEGLSGLAACWRVAVDRGAGLAAGLERLEAALRADRDQRADLQAQLAGSRSTAVLLAGLPVLGLLLGTALGAHPLRVLLHSGPGLACLGIGGALEGAGVWWAMRIVRGAEAA
ncbi:type II secretion system F family protein [Streptomyces sp. NPDC048664]|uniref:type II secretion system F family protein n=1 Tax=Streptomyces sp. NPDC048664 TaxID=3154505 RepID=UPI003445A3DE